MTNSVDNRSTEHNRVGRFMVAAGSVIEYEKSNTILIVRRSVQLDWNPGVWEICYGRIGQGETVEEGLRREVAEELGISTLTVGSVLRVWHLYRGAAAPENELIGITYHCTTTQKDVHLSDEHDAYDWVNPETALERIPVEGIREDIRAYQKYTTAPGR